MARANPSLGQPVIADRDAIKARRNDLTARISETTRYIGFALLAIFYAMISGKDAFFIGMRETWPLPLRLMALCGALAVLLDYLQYVSGYLAAERALDRTDVPNTFNTRWPSYRLAIACFWTKQVAALAGSILLIFLVGQGLR